MSTPPNPDQPPQPAPGDPLGHGPEAPTPPPPGDPPPPGGAPRRLTRSRDDRVLGGVAGGLAKFLGVDPVIVRILAVVLVFFGGAGVLLYLAALLLVPNEGEPAPQGPQRNRSLIVLGIVALVIVAWPFGLVAAGLVVPLSLLVLAGLAVAWFSTGSWPERDAGAIAKSAALGLGLLLVLLVVACGAFWLAAAGGDWVVASLVIAAGAAVLAGAFLRPVRWLVPLAFALAIPAGVVSAAGVELDGGYGERTYRPSSSAQVQERYEMAAGDMLIDLRDVVFLDRRYDVDVQLGMGEVTVLVPTDVCVVTRAELGAGEAIVFGERRDGINVEFRDAARASSGPLLQLDAEIGLGALRVSSDDGDWTDYGPPLRDRGPFDVRPDTNACAN